VKNFTFKKSERLRKRSEFIRLKRTGKRFHNKYFIAEFAAGKFERTRLGITVSKRTGSAVLRNRLKRVIRESFRHNRQYLSNNLDINIIVKKEAASIHYYDAFSSLQEMFKRLEKRFDN